MLENKSHLNAGENHVMKPALLLDLDGTVRRSKSGKTFIEDRHDIEIIPGVKEVIADHKNAGFLIAGISNQGGVAHGIKTSDEVEAEIAVTNEMLDDMFDVIKACYPMVDGKVEPYNFRSMLRKPEIGMLAWLELDAWKVGIVIDWDQSIFVGDRSEDYMCARRAGIQFYQPKDFFGPEHPADIFNRLECDNLSHSNYWYDARRKWPEAVTSFLDWIDAWKKANNWIGDKFHFWPMELQMALLSKFAMGREIAPIYCFDKRDADYLFTNLTSLIKKNGTA